MYLNKNEKKDIQNKTAIATKWSSITEIVAKIVSPISNMILARLLTPEAFGIVATITMITSFAEIFTDAGFQKYIIQHDFKSEKELDENTTVAFWTNMICAIIIFLIINFNSQQLATLVGNPGLGIVITTASLSIIINSFSSIQIARFKRSFDFKTLFYIRIVTCIIPIIVTVPIAYFTHSYWALIVGNLCSNIVNAIILTYKSKWKPFFYYNIAHLKRMFGYSWWILLESIAIWLTSYIGTFIVGMYMSPYYVGLYKTSITTVNQITSLITAATSMPLFVALSRLKNQKDELEEVYCNYIQAISVFVIPLGVGVWLYRDFVTTILLGSQWGEAANFIGLWALVNSICLVLGTYCNGLYNAIGKTKLSLLSQILQLVILIPVLIIFSPQGFEKLYVARCIARLELVVVQMIIMKFIIKFPLFKLIKKIVPSILGTVVMTSSSIFLFKQQENFWLQIIEIICCIIIYFLFLFITNRKIIINTLVAFGVKNG